MQSRRRRMLVLALSALLLAWFPIRAAIRLSADPAGEKDCAAAEEKDTAGTNFRPAGDGGLPWVQRGGTINDVSCLNRTPVSGIVEVRDEEMIRRALAFARENRLPVSIAGVRHSMGGQAFGRGSVVLDMRKFNRIAVDRERKLVRVQSGATWHDIQEQLHPAFAVKAMQSTDIFTVGGSISVNAHGMDHRAGSVGRTVRHMRVMLADGSVHQVSRTEQPELFRLVIGGYGLFGVILDAEIDITENRVYESARRTLDYQEFPRVFRDEIASDARYTLMYGHLSTSPASFLREMFLYTYREADVAGAEIPPLPRIGGVRLRRLVFNLSKRGPLPMRVKWWAEKYLEPRLEACDVKVEWREGCFVSRNGPMHDSVTYLMNDFSDETDILHEYFIPPAQFVPFIDGLRAVAVEHDANLLNASVRIVHREDNFLTYAPDEMIAVVLYLNQGTDAASSQRMARLTRALIDLTHQVGGRFFLPYQLHYTPEQLRSSYPQIGEFFALKRKYDPDGLFTNTFYRKYNGASSR